MIDKNKVRESKCRDASTDFADKMLQRDVIGHVIGDWGPWQLRTVLIIFLCKIPAAWFMACLIFTGPEPNPGELFCQPPDSIGHENKSDFFPIAHPPKENGDGLDICFVFENAEDRWNNLNSSDPDDGQDIISENGRLIPCDNFMHTGEIRSIVTDFDLVCSRTILVALTQTFHLLGVLIGGVVANQMLYRCVIVEKIK